MMDKWPRQGRVKMRRISLATEVGDCWVCGHGKLWHRLLGWLLHHYYDPIRAPGGLEEIQRLDRKYRGTS